MEKKIKRLEDFDNIIGMMATALIYCLGAFCVIIALLLVLTRLHDQHSTVIAALKTCFVCLGIMIVFAITHNIIRYRVNRLYKKLNASR